MISHWDLLMVLKLLESNEPHSERTEKPHGRKTPMRKKSIVVATKCGYKPPTLIMGKTLWWWLMLGWSRRVGECPKDSRKGKYIELTGCILWAKNGSGDFGPIGLRFLSRMI